jgi:prevent-host-death family protein
MDMTKSITLKALRPKLPRVIDEIDSKMDRFIVTKRGKPVALMMSVDDYESLLETLDILSNSKLIKKIKRAEADIKRGRIKTLDKIDKELGIV